MQRNYSAQTRTRKREKIASKFLWIGGAALLLLIAVVALILIFSNRKIEAETGAMSFATEADGILIRKEKLYKSENYGKTSFLAEEGQAVQYGDEIAEVYSWDYDQSAVNALSALQEKIMDYLETNILDKDNELASLNESVAAKMQEIEEAVKTGKGSLLKLERELKQLMAERISYLREHTAKDAQLKEFYQEEAALETRINDWKQIVYAEEDGVVSFYFDGTESLLTPENMAKLTVQNINDVIHGKTYDMMDKETVSRPLYRLVNPNQWYAILVSDAKIPEFEVENVAFQVEFSKGEQYQAKIVNEREDSGKYIYTLFFEQHIDKLLLARQVEMKISADYVGLIVPESAIKTKDDQKGVYYQKGETRVFEPVIVYRTEDGNALIEAVDAASELKAGSQVYY